MPETPEQSSEQIESPQDIPDIENSETKESNQESSNLELGSIIAGKEIIDSKNGQFLVQNEKTGELKIATTEELSTQSKTTTTTIETAPITPPPEEVTLEIIEAAVGEKVDNEQVMAIVEETKIEITEPDTGDINLDAGEKLKRLFEARKNKITGLTKRTELQNVSELDYDEIDNLYCALTVLQMGLKKMIIPIEQQKNIFTGRLSEFSSSDFAGFEAIKILKEKMESLRQQLDDIQKEIGNISSAVDNQQRWWDAQYTKEEHLIEKIFSAQMHGEDFDDWDKLPDRIIIALEDRLEGHNPPLNHPLETQEFYSNRKKTAEEFFKKLMLDPARFFDKLKEKERAYVIATTRFNHDSHSEQFARAYAQFKLFVNKYVERFNNMLIIMGIKERIDYDYNPNYRGRAQDMKNLWAEIWNQNENKIRDYQNNLQNNNQAANNDVELEQRNMAA